MKFFRKRKKAWLFALLVLGIAGVSVYYSQHAPVSETPADLVPQEVKTEDDDKEEDGELHSVLHVYDGDTFTVRMPDGSVESVRLLGIDALEWIGSGMEIFRVAKPETPPGSSSLRSVSAARIRSRLRPIVSALKNYHNPL